MNEMIEAILKHYGEDTERLKAIEEMAELTQAILKEDRESILEEFADVKITLTYISKIYNLTDEEVNEVVMRKLNRQINRMSSEIKKELNK